jgi:hypothetical protein
MKAYGGLDVWTQEFKTLAVEYVIDCIRSPTAFHPEKMRTGDCVGHINKNLILWSIRQGLLKREGILKRDK